MRKTRCCCFLAKSGLFSEMMALADKGQVASSTWLPRVQQICIRKYKARSYTKFKIGPISLSCALRNLGYDCEKGRLANQIFIFLKCFHHSKRCKLIFSGICDHFARFEITKICLRPAVQQRFRLSLFVLHQPPN